MGVLAGIGHQVAGLGGHQRFGDRTPTDVGKQLRAKCLKPRQRTLGAGTGKHVLPHGDDDGGACRTVADGQIGQRATFGQREMRAAKGDKINLRRPQVEFSPNARKVGAGDGDTVGGFRKIRCLGRVARDMQHRRGRGGAKSGAHRLQIIARRDGCLQPG